MNALEQVDKDILNGCSGYVRDYYPGKRVVVTGHKGFVGSRLCAALTSLGATVTGVDSVTREDVRDLRPLEEVFREAPSPSLCFHLAAKTEVRASFDDPWLTYQTNVLGTLNVLECCRITKTPLVLASSDKAYGRQLPPFKISDPLLHNADPYSSSKAMADELAQVYERVFRLPIHILRPCNIYGPGQRNRTTLITGVITGAMEGQTTVVRAPESEREWLFISDAILEYLEEGAVADARCNQVVKNVGSGEVASVERVVSILRLCLANVTVEVRNGEVVNQSVVDRRYESRCVKLTEGLKRTVQWHQEGCP